VISLFIAIMAAGTAYDIILIQWPKWRKAAMQAELSNETVFEASEKAPLIGEKQVEINYKPGI
jgi:hypothetical protein